MTAAPPPEKMNDAQPYVIRRLTVEQYHQMIAAGILTEDDAVELLEGWLIEKMPKNPSHSVANTRTRKAFERLLVSGWLVNAQEPITTADSEPEPDISVVRGDEGDYVEHHPQPADVALIVEVSDATLQRDRTVKLRLYAKARIPVYWILNLPERTLEVYTEPAGEGANAQYRQRRTYVETDSTPVWIDGQEVGQVVVGDLLA